MPEFSMSKFASTEDLLKAKVEYYEKKLAMIERKFQSSNDIEVDRITINRSEWYNTD